MSWSNSTNQYYDNNMDSADVPNQRDTRLCIRNHAAPAPDGTWRAEIKETATADQKALRVVGMTSQYGKIQVSAENLQFQEVLCGVIQGMPGFGGSDNGLHINAERVPSGGQDHPLNVTIGVDDLINPQQLGSLVSVYGHCIGIGRQAQADFTERVRLASPVNVPGWDNNHDARVSIDGRLEARALDFGLPGDVLKIGPDNATGLELGFHGPNRTVPTVVRGALTVQRPTTLTGGIEGALTVGTAQTPSTVTLFGDVAVSQGSLTVGSQGHLAPATIHGALTVTDGDLTVGTSTDPRNAVIRGQLRTNTVAPATMGSTVVIDAKADVAQSLFVRNGLNVIAGGASITDRTEITNAAASKPMLAVTHTATSPDAPALRVTHTAHDPAATGVEVNAVIAISANGETILSNPDDERRSRNER
jgi:hypothetical protein